MHITELWPALGDSSEDPLLSRLRDYLLFSGQMEAAVKHCRKLIDLHPDFFSVPALMVRALLQCLRFNECIASACKAADLSGVLHPWPWADWTHKPVPSIPGKERQLVLRLIRSIMFSADHQLQPAEFDRERHFTAKRLILMSPNFMSA
jgi:hypothetical protein